MNFRIAFAIAIALSLILMGVMYLTIQEREKQEACYTSSEWIVHERTTNRQPTNQEHISLLSWDFELRCVEHPEIRLIYNVSRPTWAQIDQTVTFVPRIN